MLTEYSSPFLKIEYINFLLDHNIYDKYFLIENLKLDKDIMANFIDL